MIDKIQNINPKPDKTVEEVAAKAAVNTIDESTEGTSKSSENENNTENSPKSKNVNLCTPFSQSITNSANVKNPVTLNIDLNLGGLISAIKNLKPNGGTDRTDNGSSKTTSTVGIETDAEIDKEKKEKCKKVFDEIKNNARELYGKAEFKHIYHIFYYACITLTNSKLAVNMPNIDFTTNKSAFKMMFTEPSCALFLLYSDLINAKILNSTTLKDSEKILFKAVVLGLLTDPCKSDTSIDTETIDKLKEEYEKIHGSRTINNKELIFKPDNVEFSLLSSLLDSSITSIDDIGGTNSASSKRSTSERTMVRGGKKEKTVKRRSRSDKTLKKKNKKLLRTVKHLKSILSQKHKNKYIR